VLIQFKHSDFNKETPLISPEKIVDWALKKLINGTQIKLKESTKALLAALCNTIFKRDAFFISLTNKISLCLCKSLDLTELRKNAACLTK
jgi:hypothetical protein